jgi:phosphoglucosamine mutase
LINVRVHSKAGLDDAEPVWSAVREAEARLGDDGRVLLRASGTEPVVRVMVEAPDKAQADAVAARLAAVVKAELAI